MINSSDAAFSPHGGQEGPVNALKPLLHMGAITSPGGCPLRRNDGNPRGIDGPSCRRGLQLSHFAWFLVRGSCGVTGASVPMLQRPVDHLPRTCAQPHDRSSLPKIAREIPQIPPIPSPDQFPCSQAARLSHTASRDALPGRARSHHL